jgi:hypothetical protein
LGKPDDPINDDGVSATATRNFLLRDPLVDWLEPYGREHGLVPDDGQPDYDARLEFGPFITGRGIAFEAAVAAYFRTLSPVSVIADDHRGVRDPRVVVDTLEAMAAGHPVIHQSVLHDAQTQTYGRARTSLAKHRPGLARGAAGR